MTISTSAGWRRAGLAWGLVLVALGATVAGCGKAAGGREQVTGTVTLDGQPAAEGMVSFEPIAGTNAPNAGAAIVGGKFEIPAEAGVVPGKYKVKVVTSKPTGRTSEGPGGMQVPEMAPVNLKEAAGTEVTIVQGGPNQLELKVTAAR